MASQLINLNQLQLSMARIKQYCDNTFDRKGHNHDDMYYTELEVDNIRDNLIAMISAKASSEHTHTSEDIVKMTGYAKASTASDILVTDDLNTAIGKLEKAVDGVSYESHRHDDLYLGINATAASAKQLESSRIITLGGAVSGSASFDGSADVTISTTIANMSSDKINSMTGYVKPDDTSDISTTDSLNVAIGKLEKALDEKQVAGDYASAIHDHSSLYYTKEEISDLLSGISGEGSVELAEAKAYTDSEIAKLTGDGVSEALDTLKELGDALGNDANFASTVTSSLANKADKDHTHDEATTDTAGFMSASDKSKLDGIEAGANNYVHPTGVGYNHIPSGGASGQALIWSADGVAEWGSVSSTDQYVRNTLDTTAVAYITGTTSDATGVGEQVFDTGVYLTNNAGELKATNFIGDLDGTATNAITAESCTGNAATASLAERTRYALGISVNGVLQGSFDGSAETNIDITAASIGAVTTTQLVEATTQATTDEVTAMLEEVFSA